SAAPGTSRITRRTAAISWVTVSWVATASSSTVESSARRCLPASTPVAATTCRTAENSRSGSSERPSRRRKYVSNDGSKPPSSNPSPHAAFHRRSHRTCWTASKSDSPSSACSTTTAASTCGGRLGRPFGEGYISANIPAGNSTSRCSAKNANTPPAGISSRQVCHTSGPTGSPARSPCMPTTLPRQRPWQASTYKIFSDLLGRLAVLPTVRQRDLQLPARADAQLGENLAQVPFDGARGQEQLRADLRVSAAVSGQPGDLLLLRRELLAGLSGASAHLLARGDQFPAGALGERLHADRGEHVVGRAQLLARVEPPALPAQPFTVEEMRAGQVRAQLGSAQPVDRVAVQGLGGGAVAQQRPAAGLN